MKNKCMVVIEAAKVVIISQLRSICSHFDKKTTASK
jgi:hypothetical protein